MLTLPPKIHKKSEYKIYYFYPASLGLGIALKAAKLPPNSRLHFSQYGACHQGNINIIHSKAYRTPKSQPMDSELKTLHGRIVWPSGEWILGTIN